MTYLWTERDPCPICGALTRTDGTCYLCAPRTQQHTPADTSNTCPGCMARLESRRCKQRCASCGYFDDCSIGPA